MPIRALTCALLLLGACSEYAEPSLTPGQKKKVEASLVAEAKPQHPIGAIIEDQVELLGYDIDKTSVKPGESFTITYYIKALRDQLDDNKIFVHFQGKPGDRAAWMNLDHHPVEGLWPLRNLKKGQIIRDVQVVKVKKEFPPGPAKVYWGLWRGDYRLKIKAPGKNGSDKEGRVVVAPVTVEGKVAPPKPLPLAVAGKLPAGETITVDGKLDEPHWAKLAWTPYWTTPDGRGGVAPRTRARFTWDDTHLYVAVEAEDSDVWSTFTDRDSNTWEQEVIELFIDADGDKKDYLELQVTPANVIFDAKFASHRSDLAKARAWNMAGFKTAVHVDGTLNARDDQDKGYTVEMAIPFAEVPGATPVGTDGQIWRVNLFRWDAPKAGRQQAAAFSPPVVGDFHALDRFGRLRFVDPALTKTPTLGVPGQPLLKREPIKLDLEKIRKARGSMKIPAAPASAPASASAQP